MKEAKGRASGAVKRDWEPWLIEARYLGQHARTGAMIGITTDGIVCGRLGRRFPKAERWDQTGWQDLKGVPWDLRLTGVPAPEIDQLKMMKRKEHSQGMGPKNPRRKQPGNGTQEPKKKTARDRDPRTREQTVRSRDPKTLEEKEHTQPQGGKELEQVTCECDAKTKAAAATAVAFETKARAAFEGQNSDRIAKSDVVKGTMSAVVKLAKEIDEPDIGQPTAECHLMAWLYERRRVTQRDELLPVQGGAEDTDERVMTSHTEMCEDCEVTSVEEGHDVERVTAQNGEIVGSLKQLKGETSADLTAFEKKGLDRKTNHQGLMKTETKEIFVLTNAIEVKETVALKLEQSAKEVAQRPPPWKETSFERVSQVRSQKSSRTTEVSQCCGLHPRIWSIRPQSKKG